MVYLILHFKEKWHELFSEPSLRKNKQFYYTVFPNLSRALLLFCKEKWKSGMNFAFQNWVLMVFWKFFRSLVESNKFFLYSLYYFAIRFFSINLLLLLWNSIGVFVLLYLIWWAELWFWFDEWNFLSLDEKLFLCCREVLEK